MCYVLRGTILHGVFEIPATILAMFLSFSISKEVTMALYELICGKRTIMLRGKNIGILLLGWMHLVIPAYLAAALIETYLAPLIM